MSTLLDCSLEISLLLTVLACLPFRVSIMRAFADLEAYFSNGYEVE